MTEEKRLTRWADNAMFTAEPVNADVGPQVYLLEMTSDPLGSIAALSAMYTGKVTRSKADVTNEERAHHLREMQLTKLTTPLEAVKFHFMIEGVTRAFTHQLVRNRTSAYAQESMRFAVKEDMPVALPPSIAHVALPRQAFTHPGCNGDDIVWSDHQNFDRLSNDEKMRVLWEESVSDVRDTYNRLIALGMPAEDARGLAPTNVLTRINWVTDLRTLIDVLGVRLCTQAQFEWRAVATQIAAAIAGGYKLDRRWLSANDFYCSSEAYGAAAKRASDDMEHVKAEYAALASLFRPICYITGKCEFMSAADRECSIRERVQANHKHGIPSSQWGEPHLADPTNPKIFGSPEIYAILPEEWMFDPSAAR